MRVNTDKSKVMKVPKQYGTAKIGIGGMAVEQVDSFGYLGGIIIFDGSCTGEIKGTIPRAKAAFNKAYNKMNTT